MENQNSCYRHIHSNYNRQYWKLLLHLFYRDLDLDDLWPLLLTGVRGDRRGWIRERSSAGVPPVGHRIAFLVARGRRQRETLRDGRLQGRGDDFRQVGADIELAVRPNTTESRRALASEHDLDLCGDSGRDIKSSGAFAHELTIDRARG